MKRSPLLQIHKNNYKKIIRYFKSSKINKNFKYKFVGIIKNNDIFYIHLECCVPELSNLIYNFGEKSFITTMSDIEVGILTSVNFYFRFLSHKNFSKNNFMKENELQNIDDINMLKENEFFINQRILNPNPNYCYIRNNKIICINDPFNDSRIKIDKKIHINIK